MEKLKFLMAMAVIFQTTSGLTPENSESSSKLSSVMGLRNARDGYNTDGGRNARFFGSYFGHGQQMPPEEKSYYGYNGNRAGAGSGYEDRNWYYQPDRYDTRNRYDDRYTNRYDDRGADYNRPSTYDRYNPQQYNGNSQYDTRGNGYDNRDAVYYDRSSDRGYYGYDARDYYNRDRGDTGYQMNSRGYYDYKNFRPWDETYRGVSGFDNSGRGYYFGNGPQAPPSSIPLEGGYRVPPHSYYEPRPQSPPLPPSPPLQSQHHYSQLPPRPLNQEPPAPVHHNYDRDYHSPSKGGSAVNANDNKNGYAGSWGYDSSRDREKDRNSSALDKDYRNRDRDKDRDSASNTYGSRQRPVAGGASSLGTSYLHDRESNTAPVTDELKGDPKDVSQDDSPHDESNTNTAAKDD